MTVAATRSAATISAGKVPASSSDLWRVVDEAIWPGNALLGQTGAHLRNYRLDRDALGSGREIDRHAVPQDGTGQRHDVVDRRREAALDDGACAACQHERLAGARAGAPGDALAHEIEVARFRTPGAHQ